MNKLIILIAATLMLTITSEAGVRDDWYVVAEAVASTGNTTAAIKINEAVNAVSDEELNRIYGDVNLMQLAEKFNASRVALQATDYALGQRLSQKTLNDLIIKSADFPDAVGYPTTPLCPFSPDRSNADDLLIAVDAIAIARVALESAEVLWSGLSRACDETIVILGEGGNLSLACIPADIALFAAELIVGAAETVVENLDFCDAAVDAAEIEGSYERLDHMHTDLSTHDAEVKVLLAALQGAVDENQRLIKILSARQLETLRLLITQQGRREINTEVLTCTGDDCPVAPEDVIVCSGGDYDWPCLTNNK